MGSDSAEFPIEFRWGVGQSAFQFEMGDRYRRFIDANSDWWHWIRDPENIARRLVSSDLPEDGADYLEMYRTDHENAKNLGLNIYRIGIEWSRIFPYPTWVVDVEIERDSNGLIKEVKIDEEALRRLDRIANRHAIAMYRDIILDLRARGFKVIVNLHHFTIPMWLHDPIKTRSSGLREGPLGLLEDIYPVEFAKYAAYAAWRLGDLVDMWCTMNEPMVPVELGYLYPETGFPPGVVSVEGFLKGYRNLVLAHALAYDAIKKFDRVRADSDSKEPAEVGIIYNIIPAYSLSDNDQRAAEDYEYFHNEAFLRAIAEGVLDMGFNRKDIVKPSALGRKKLEWLGVNYYTRVVVRKPQERILAIGDLYFEGVPGYGYSCIPNGISMAGRWCSDNGWEFYPEGIARAIEIGKKYSDIIYVTENGVADARDIYRPQYLINHIYAVKQMIERGVNIYGYMYWALIDNYEWAQGYRMKFGLYEVDLATKQRVPRPSVKIYGDIARSNKIPGDYLRKHLIEPKGL